MTARSVLVMCDDYKKARISFVQNVAELASRSKNVDVLKSAGVLDLLRPLLGDACPQIQQSAVIALGRMANHDREIAERVVSYGLLSVILSKICTRNKYYKKAAMFIARSVCKHDARLANEVLNPDDLQALMTCLTDLDSGVKEAAAWVVGCIAKHNHALAKALVDAGAVPHLVLCLQEPELPVKCVAASALANMAKHSADLAQSLQDSNAITYLAKATMSHNEKLKQQALTALSSIAAHNITLAEAVLQADVFPSTLVYMNHTCELVRINATMLMKEIVKHSVQLANFIVNMGGIGALIEAIKVGGGSRMPAIVALGFIAGHSVQMATCIVCSDGVTVIAKVLQEECNDELLSATVWTIGQLSTHCPEQVATSGVMPRLLELYEDQKVSHELRSRCRVTLKLSVHGCTNIAALEPLLQRAPPDLLKYVLGQLVKILPNDPRARRAFVASGGFKRIQEIKAEPGSTVFEHIAFINACFPEEIVRYFSPGYSDTLLDIVENFIPLLRDEGNNEDVDYGRYPSVSVSQERNDKLDDWNKF